MKIVLTLAVFTVFGAHAKPLSQDISENEDISDVTKSVVNFFERTMIPLLAHRKFDDIISNMELFSSTLYEMKDLIPNYPAILNMVNNILVAARSNQTKKDNRPKIYVNFKELEKALKILAGTSIQIYLE